MSALPSAIAQLRNDQEQSEAFQAEGHCAVLAPPGSGKTQLLTTKLAYALATDRIAPPRGAACITMTNEAAMELKRRLRKLGVRPRSNLFVGTVHAFALSRIVLPYAGAAGLHELASSCLASDDEADEAFDVAFRSMGFEPREHREVRHTMHVARMRLDLSGNPRLGGPRIAETATRFQAELAKRKLYDFDDLVRHAVEMIEGHDWIRAALQSAFQRIYVDEYQDLAPGLDRIVRQIALADDSHCTLFAVGDPDQAIYGFSGAHPELLRRLAAEPRVLEVKLRHNYRCPQQIIDASLRALGEQRDVAGQRDGGTLEIHAASADEKEQAYDALEIVESSVAAGTEHDQIAIVAPWGADRDRCMRALREADIPVFARAGEHWRVTPLTMTLESLASWAHRREAAGVALHELLEAVRDIAWQPETHAALRGVTSTLLNANGSTSAHAFVEDIVAAAFDAYVEESVETEDRRELQRMREALSPSGKAASMTVAELGARARAPGHVLASTIHGAKGLEFDVVILVGADETCLPGFKPTRDETAEARRKFYVTITRARQHVHVCFPSHRTSRRGKPYATAPSPFLAELATATLPGGH